MLAVGAGSVDQREAFPVAGKQACLSAHDSNGVVGLRVTPAAQARTEAREARLNLY